MDNHPTLAYQEFIEYLSPDGNDRLAIRNAFFDKFWPDNVGTRNITKFKYVVVPVLLDLMEMFYDTSAVIDANVFFFKKLADTDIVSGSITDAPLLYALVKYIADIVKLGLGDVEVDGDDVTELTERHFPDLSALLLGDESGSRHASSEFIDFGRLLFNLKSLLVIFNSQETLTKYYFRELILMKCSSSGSIILNRLTNVRPRPIVQLILPINGQKSNA